MSNPAYMPPLRSAVFPSDAKCPQGYILVESAEDPEHPHSGFRSHTHLAAYETVSAMARGVRGTGARTICGKQIVPFWRLTSTVREDQTPTKTTCRACLTAIRKALA